MRIAVNCRSILLTQRTGIGRYTYHLLDHLGKIDQANQYCLQVPKGLFDFKRRLPNFKRYQNFSTKLDFFRQGIKGGDIYHLPCPDEIPQYSGKLIVTIHDLIHKTYPQSQTPQTTELTEKYIQAITAQADHIICISANTRQDWHRYYNIPQEKTSVVYNGVDHSIFYPLSNEEHCAAREHLKTLGIHKPYVLYVGTIEPRKNLDGLLESFAKLKSKGVFDGQLVVAGMKGWMVDNIVPLIEKLGLTHEVLFLGFISDAELAQLYNRAEIFVFPSFYEGFGFPIIEAFSCGAAVVTSKSSSCGEIAGDAALTIDPNDSRSITDAMERVLTDKKFNSSLRESGLKRAQEFSFKKMAQDTLEIYQRLGNS